MHAFFRVASRLLALLVLVTLVGCAHFSAIEDVPEPYRARFARHTEWLSVAVFDHPPGTFPPSEVSVVKRWRVELANGRAVRLRETNSSSLAGLFDRMHRREEALWTVDLERRIDPVAFLPFRGHAVETAHGFGADEYRFQALDDERFQIFVNGGRLRLVFLPAPSDHRPVGTPPADAPATGVWTAPFGAESELLEHLKKLLAIEGDKAGGDKAGGDKKLKSKPPLLPGLPPNGAYLHHDLSTHLRVVVDRSFPEAYRPAVTKALTRWNALLRHDLLVLVPGVAKIDVGDCVSGPTVCIRWIGAPDLPFTGANGYTELSFDPGTGRIVGAVISVINDDVVPPLQEMAPEDRRRVVDKTLDWNWVARAMHRFGDFNGTAHPLPLDYVEYLLLHEMGHMNGFGHNFFVSGKTSVERPITSVMSYPPFPVGHLANYLGEADKSRLALVYGGKPLPPADYCSTLDAMMPHQDEGGLYHKPPNCDLFVVGNQAEWYIRLAQAGKTGVFTSYPDLSHMSEDLRVVYDDMAERRRLPPLNVLTRLGFIMADNSAANIPNRKRITQYLCSLQERPRIALQLVAYHAVKLNCDGVL